MPTRLITIKPFQLTHIARLCAQVHAHVHTREDWWSRLALRNLIVRSVISETGSLAQCNHFACEPIFELPTPRQCLLIEIDVHLSSRLPRDPVWAWDRNRFKKILPLNCFLFRLELISEMPDYVH